MRGFMYSVLSVRKRLGLFLLIDSIAIVISFFGAFILRFDFTIPVSFNSFYIVWLPIFILGKLSIYVLFGFYRGIWRYTSLWDIINIVKASLFASVALIILFAFTVGFSGFPRSIFLSDFILSVILVSSSRVAVRIYFSHFYFEQNDSNKAPKKRLLLVGAGQTGEKITREIINTPSSEYSVVGFVDDDPGKHHAQMHGYRVWGKVSDIESLSIQYEEILITAPSATGDQMRRIVAYCKKTGKRYKTVPSLSEIINNDVTIRSIRDVSYMDLLGREEIKLNMNSIDQFIKGKRLLVTGAGGSIGSELVRQCLSFRPAMLLLVDISEYNLFMIEQELNKIKPQTSIRYILGDVRDKDWLSQLYHDYKPQVILHAAAYKHVPIQEKYPREAVLTNVLGTLNLIELSVEFEVEKFVLVSTDKAVHPVNVMGATKRLAEIMVQCINHTSKTEFMAVRFGNVLGSSGSVIPLFQEQIKNGGPVRITHPDMIRYFMSIPEAAQLILQAGALGRGGEVFVLDMGKPVKIREMAYDLIRLSGLEPEKDIPIIYTGVRPGEKLFEELVIRGENISRTEHSKILTLRNGQQRIAWDELIFTIEKLIITSRESDSDLIKKHLRDVVPEYEPGEITSSPLKDKLQWDIDSQPFEA